jgi:hypothetical protein
MKSTNRNSFFTIFIWITILFCFTSCSNKPIVVPKIVDTYKLELTIKNITFFEGVKDISKLFYYYDESNDKEYLLAYDIYNKHFIIFDYETGNVLTEFSIEFRINSLYIKSIDSIYVSFDDAFGEKGNIFGLIDFNGKIIDRINLYNKMIIPEVDSTGNFNLLGDKNIIQLANNPYFFSNFCIFDETMYMNIALKKNISNKYDYPVLAFIKMDNIRNQIIKYNYNYPSYYRESNYKMANYMDFIVKKDKRHITNIINSFILSDSVYINRLVPKFEANNMSVINDPDYDTLITKNVASKYKSEILPNTNYFRGTIAYYFGFKYVYLKYDPFRNYFYRIALHTLDNDNISSKDVPKGSNDETLAYARKVQNWSIIVADSDMNLLTEKLMLASDNYYSNILVTKNGIGLININDDNTNIAENAKNGVNITKTSIRIIKEKL